MNSVITKPPRTMLEVYQSLPEGTLIQLIENELILSPAPLEVHQAILTYLSADILFYVRKNSLGTIRVAPYDIYLDKKNVFQPDIVFISNENLHNIKADGLHGAPDLVIEILSPSTAKYDLEDKKDVYERYGVKEYWIIDPSSKSVTGFTLKEKTFVSIEINKGIIKSLLLKNDFQF